MNKIKFQYSSIVIKLKTFGFREKIVIDIIMSNAGARKYCIIIKGNFCQQNVTKVGRVHGCSIPLLAFDFFVKNMTHQDQNTKIKNNEMNTEGSYVFIFFFYTSLNKIRNFNQEAVFLVLRNKKPVY